MTSEKRVRPYKYTLNILNLMSIIMLSVIVFYFVMSIEFASVLMLTYIPVLMYIPLVNAKCETKEYKDALLRSFVLFIIAIFETIFLTLFFAIINGLLDADEYNLICIH